MRRLFLTNNGTHTNTLKALSQVQFRRPGPRSRLYQNLTMKPPPLPWCGMFIVVRPGPPAAPRATIRTKTSNCAQATFFCGAECKAIMGITI
jgi:hypothetical protein